MLPTYTRLFRKNPVDTKIQYAKIGSKSVETPKPPIQPPKQPEIKIMCPQCHKDPGGIVYNDGGSHSCQHCKTKFHYCASYEAVKYGSPGPSMCEDCRSYESHWETIEDREIVHFKRYLFNK